MKRIIGLLIGIIGIVYLFSGSQKVVQAAPKSLRQVVADQVQYGDYTLQLKLIAQAENPQFSNLQSLYPGQVSTILVKEGQAIKKVSPWFVWMIPRLYWMIRWFKRVSRSGASNDQC